MKTFKISTVIFFLTLFVLSGTLSCTQTQNTNSSLNNTSAISSAALDANASPAPSLSAATPDELASARKTYTEVCARCHKENGEGGAIENDFGKLKVPNLKTEGKIKDPDSEFIEQIVAGGDGMPAFRDKLSEQEIKDLVKFIRTDIQGK